MTTVVDMGVFSSETMGCASIIVEHMTLVAQRLFSTDASQQSKSTFEIRRVVNHILLYMRYEGTDPKVVETQAEALLKLVAMDIEKLGVGPLDKLKTRALARLEREYGSVRDYAEEDGEDVYVSHGETHTVRETVRGLLGLIGVEAVKRGMRVLVAKNPRRLVLEVTNCKSCGVVEPFDVLGGLKPRLVLL